MARTRNPHKTPPPPIRLPQGDEQGEAFSSLVKKRAGSSRAASRHIAFLEEWDEISDELGHEPTVGEYAARWGVSAATVHRYLREFRDLFPTERTPRRILAVLWDGMSEDEFQPLMAVRVVPEDTDT